MATGDNLGGLKTSKVITTRAQVAQNIGSDPTRTKVALNLCLDLTRTKVAQNLDLELTKTKVAQMRPMGNLGEDKEGMSYSRAGMRSTKKREGKFTTLT